MTNLSFQEGDEGVVFVAKIVPGSSGSTRICGLLDDMLKIKVSAAPEKGKANKALIDFIAKKLGIKSKAVSILSGHKTAVKRVQASGIRADEIAKAFT